MAKQIKKIIKKVAIYVRKSREEETEETLKRQQSVLIDLCESNGWEYVLYKEVGSSQDLDRPRLQEMLEQVKLFHFDGVVMADLDRLSRNTGHFAAIKEVFISAGCHAITPNKVYDFGKQEDDLFSDLQSVLAKNEYQTIKRRLVRGTRQSAKDGNWLGKKVPVGYVYDKEIKRLELSKDAPIIRRMFDEYMHGSSTKDIAYKFIFENVVTMDTKEPIIWTPAGISRLLNNPVYKGDSVYGRTTNKNGKRAVKTDIEDQIIVEDTHTGIITKEEWDKVQRIKLNRNSRPLALKQGKHKFSGLVRCALCSRVHSFQTSKYKRKRITTCQTRNFKENSDKYTMCENQGCNIIDFENLFYHLVQKYIDQLEDYIDQIKKVKTGKSNSNSNNDVDYIERQIKKINQEIKRVQQGFIMEIFTDDEAHQQIKGFKAQKEKLEKQLDDLKEMEDDSSTDHLTKVLDNLKGFMAGKDNLPEREANELLTEYIDTIIYEKSVHNGSKIDLQIVWKENLIEGEEDV